MPAVMRATRSAPSVFILDGAGMLLDSEIWLTTRLDYGLLVLFEIRETPEPT
jgi:hypothetical protein